MNKIVLPGQQVAIQKTNTGEMDGIWYERLRALTDTVNSMAGGGGGGMSIGGAITSGTAPSVLFIGPGGVLAQDPTNFGWNDTNHILQMSGKNALYNASSTNWFIGGAGNTTVSNVNNLAMGEGAGQALGNVWDTVSIGFHAGFNNTTGSENIFIGSNAGSQNTIAVQGTMIGKSAGESITGGPGILSNGNPQGSDNTLIGWLAGHSITNGNDNICIGWRSGDQLTTGADSVYIGSRSGGGNVTGSENVFIGIDVNADAVGSSGQCTFIGRISGRYNVGIYNTFIGYQAGWTSTSGNNSTYIGSLAGANITSGSNNTLIGRWPGPSGTLNNVLALSDGAGTLQLDRNYTTAGTWTFNALPTKTTPVSADTLLLQDSAATNGLKAVPWSSLPGGGGGGMSIGGAVTGGTAPAVLYIGAGNVLAEDPTDFGWNDTTKTLSIGHSGGTNAAYNVNGLPGLYIVPNASGNNWFEDNAGNPTTTGHQNFGTGDGAMASLTNGYQNCAFGPNALANCTSGDQNMAIGSQAMQLGTTLAGNVGIGISALRSIISDSGNVGLGSLAFVSATTVSESVGIGFTVGAGIGSAVQGIFIGRNAAIGIPNTTRDVFIGAYAGQAITNNTVDNVFIGGSVGYNITGASRCTILGPWLGPATTINDVVSLSAGRNQVMDWNWSKGNTWSMQSGVTPVGHHIYNTYDGANPPVNFERGVLDWNVTSNVFSIGTQAGGSGTVRPMKFVGVPNKTTPIGADHIYIADSASSDTLKTALISSLPGGGGGMSIGGAVTGGTAKSVLYVDGSGNLGQDPPHFTFDPATNYLSVGISTDTGRLYLNSLPALYQIQNASGNNWFEGNSGNATLTGYSNFGTGDGAMVHLTSGNQNTAVGINALNLCTSGSDNFAFGSQTLSNLTSGQQNAGMGTGAMVSLTTGSFNTAIGELALYSLTTGESNCAIGTNALFKASGATFFNIGIGTNSLKAMAGSSPGQNGNIAIGYNCMFQALTGTASTAIGYQAGQSLTSSNNDILIGNSAGNGMTSSNQDTFIGNGAGYNVTGAQNCTLLGGWVGPSGFISDIIAISKGSFSAPLAADYNYTYAGGWTFNQNILMSSSVALYNGAGANTATLTNAPAAGNPTKWLAVNDNGTTRYIPAW